MQNDFDILNELILNYRHQIEIIKKPNEEKTLIRLLKPSNLSNLDNKNIDSINISQKTLFDLVSYEQTTFTDNGYETTFQPNNIFNFIIKDFKIIIRKDLYSSNISAKIYKDKELINEIFSSNLNLLIDSLNLFCSTFVDNEFIDYCSILN